MTRQQKTLMAQAVHGLVLALLAAPQSQAQEGDSDRMLEEIVVTASTGTLIRGVAPTGTNVIGLDADTIGEIAAASTNDLMANVPQVSNLFNTAPTPGATIAAPFNRPNIRNLGASGGSTTLLLLNGHRMVSSGILQTSPDASTIAPGVLQRVELVPDGGSSIYGSDAIGGVINFITRGDVEGLEIGLRQGMGDEYGSTNIDLNGGVQWETGDAFIALNHALHDEILGGDRDWVYQDHSDRGDTDFRGLFCSPGTISTGGQNYRMQDGAVGSNYCDETDVLSVYPEATDTRVFAGFEQALSDSLIFNLTAYYSDRETVTSGSGVATGSGVRGNGLISAANPWFSPVGDERAHTVNFNYSDVFGDALDSTVDLSAWMITPSISWDFGEDWHLLASVNYGESANEVRTQQISTAAQAAALGGSTLATALNPYDLAQTDPGVLAGIRDYLVYGSADQSLLQARAVFDGTLATLPSGDMKIALGLEYMEETIDASQGEGASSALALVSSDAARDVASVFGEVIVPLLNSDFGQLDLAASVRYDDYSDFGSTTNPKLGVSYYPVPALTLRANWGTSFHAPSLADTGNAVDSRLQVIPISPLLAPGALPTDFFRSTMIVAGGNADLQPEEAETASLGIDWRPENGALAGLSVSGTYYRVEFTDQITLPPFTEPGFFDNASYAPFYIVNPTLDQTLAIAGGMRVENAPDIESLYANGASPYILFDARRNNLGAVEVDGIDFDIHYNGELGSGGYLAGLAGTYMLNRDVRAVEAGEVEDGLAYGVSDLQLVGTLAWRTEQANAGLRVNYSAGYDASDTVSVGSFTTVNAFAGYTFPGEGWRGDTTLSLNVDNLLDEAPPYFDDIDGYANGSTLGRVIYLGLLQKF